MRTRHNPNTAMRGEQHVTGIAVAALRLPLEHSGLVLRVRVRVRIRVRVRFCRWSIQRATVNIRS